MLKVVIIGYGEMFTNLIAGTLDSGMEIVGVLRKETIKYPPFLRWLKDIFNPSVEYNYIKSYNLPEIYAKGVNTNEFRKKLLKLNPDIVLVGSWSEKFEKATFDIPKIATINAHPSLLPKYRGPNPYFWVIKNREQISGVTFHLMDEGFDTGAILAQEEVKIYPSDTGKTLKERTVLAARGIVCELLKDLDEDIIIPLQQREEKSNYYSHPVGLELDFKKTAEDNFALIRAIYPWNEAYLYHNITALVPNPNKVIIEENKTGYTEFGTIVECDFKTKTIGVLCADNKVLKMSDINLYKKCDRLFTKNYLQREIKIGDIIL
jgi:methionyl-tRNA formyltransferase